MGSEHGVFQGALVGTGALILSEVGNLWDFQQMRLKAIDLIYPAKASFWLLC